MSTPTAAIVEMKTKKNNRNRTTPPLSFSNPNYPLSKCELLSNKTPHKSIIQPNANNMQLNTRKTISNGLRKVFLIALNLLRKPLVLTI